MNCPRCHGELAEKPLGDATVHVCDACTGALVQQRDLVHVLETVAVATLQVIDPEEPIEPMPDPGTHLQCPICDREMESFGYMSSDVVIVDRCGHDAVIWADADELGTMSILYARTNERLMRRYRADRERREQQQRHLRLQMTNRARANTIAGAMLTGPSYTAAGYGNLWQYLGLLFGREDRRDDSDA